MLWPWDPNFPNPIRSGSTSNERAQVGNESLKKITWEKITQNRFLKSKNDINNLYNCNLDDNKYEKLRMGWLRANKKYSRGSKNSETIHNFINKTVKGSKRYRTLLERDNAKNYCKALKLPQLKTYKKLTCIVDITENRAKSMYGAWNKLFLPSEIKVFLYKFYNNILGTNLRVSKFNRETNPECTFCSINGPFPVPREDFSHIFFNCPSTKKIIEEFFDEYMTISFTTCSVFFGGNIAEKEETNRPFQLVMDILRYYIWTSKLEKKPQ